MTWARTRTSVALLAASMLLGCGGAALQERFFTLASEVPPREAPTTATYSVVVGPVTVPDIVDRPQFVLRTGPNRVDIAEEARWAAPLTTEVPRVIADNLARLLDGARTSTSSDRAAATPDYRVLIDIQRFESAVNDAVTVQALWTVRAREGEPLTGQSRVTETAGAGYEALVAAHSRALASVSREIAAALATARAAARGT